jgi:Putative peptidoglycan binding domain
LKSIQPPEPLRLDSEKKDWMKKLIAPTIIVILSIAVLVMALRLRRLSPPEDYEYSFMADVDPDYYDQSALRDYYATGYAVGSFAREMWHERGIDVRFPSSDNASDQAATRHYNGMKAYADSLGARMARSKALKAEGLNNADIQLMEGTGLSLAQARLQRYYGAPQLLKGERSTGVLLLQQQLTKLGYIIPTDGYYWIETETAIRDFQTKQNIAVTGNAEAATLTALLKASPLKTP